MAACLAGMLPCAGVPALPPEDRCGTSKENAAADLASGLQSVGGAQEKGFETGWPWVDLPKGAPYLQAAGT